MNHFKVYDSNLPPATNQRARELTQRSKKVTPEKIKADSSVLEESAPGLPKDLVKTSPRAKKLSDAQIRAKIAMHQEGKAQSGSLTLGPRPSAPADPGEEKVQIVASNENLEIPKSDLARNDPKDPVTQEKLRTILSNNGFGFSTDERKVLENILGNKAS